MGHITQTNAPRFMSQMLEEIVRIAGITAKDALIACEGEEDFLGVQRFLAGVHRLTSERRLLRFMYTCSK